MSSLFALSPQDQDQLTELLNIGVAHAGTTLSKMLGRRITISIPWASLRNTETAAHLIEEPDNVMMAVLLRLTGGFDGYVCLVFTREAATHLLHALTEKNITDLSELNEFDRSVFREIGNILTGGMLQGLSQFLHMSLVQSVPDIVIDMGGAMFNTLAATMIARHDEFCLLNVNICVNPAANAIDCRLGEEATGKIFLFLGPDAVKDILTLTNSMTS